MFLDDRLTIANKNLTMGRRMAIFRWVANGGAGCRVGCAVQAVKVASLHGGSNGVPDSGPTGRKQTPDRGPEPRRGRALAAALTAAQTAGQTAGQTAAQRALLTVPVCPPDGTLRP